MSDTFSPALESAKARYARTGCESPGSCYPACQTQAPGSPTCPCHGIAEDALDDAIRAEIEAAVAAKDAEIARLRTDMRLEREALCFLLEASLLKPEIAAARREGAERALRWEWMTNDGLRRAYPAVEEYVTVGLAALFPEDTA